MSYDWQLHMQAVMQSALQRVPRPERHGSDHERVIEREMENYVRMLWAIGWLPLKTPRGWVAGLSVRCTDSSTSVGAGRMVGPKPPSRYRREYSTYVSTSTWNQ